MRWLIAHALQLAAGITALLLVGLANKGAPKIARSGKAHGSGFARWATFGIMALAGLCLAAAAIPVVNWLTGLDSAHGLGAVVGDVGTLIALAMGCQGVTMSIALGRDLSDGTPDHDARRNVLWIPTLLPAGLSAVIGVLQHPQGLGRDLTAALMGGITVIYAYTIVKQALAAEEHETFWTWFAFVVSIVGGLMAVPLIRYVDTTVVQTMVPPALRIWVRVIAGTVGLVGLAAGAWDIVCDGVPNRMARVAATWGLSLTLAFGGVALAAIASYIVVGASSMKGVL